MTTKRSIKRVENLDALGASGQTPAINVSDFREIVFDLAGADTSVLTVNLQGAIGRDNPGQGLEAPDFSAASSASNRWQYIESVDYSDGTAIDGPTGIAFTDDDVVLGTANVDGLDWIAFEVTAHTTGTVQPTVVCYSNS